MNAVPAAPQPIGRVVDDAIKLYRASFRACWPINAVAAVIVAASAMHLTLKLSSLGVVGGRSTADTMAMYRMPVLYLTYLFDALVKLAAGGAVVVCQYALATGLGLPRTMQSVGIMLRRFPKAALAASGALIMVLIASLILLFPGIYVAGTLSVWTVALFAEDKGPGQSLSESMRLVNRNWWRTCTIMTIAVVLMTVFSGLATLIAGSLIAFWHSSLLAVQLSLQLTGAVAYVFTLSMLPAAQVALYLDLKLRREGGDLAERLGALA